MDAWRVLDTGASTGAWNMAVDRALRGPVLRFYGWEPPAVSCGYGQVVEREVDMAACRALGVDVVRRPTGGRAVLHWRELTYSVVCAPADLGAGEGIEDAHRLIAECLAAGLRDCGIAVDIVRNQRRVERSRGAGATSPCFSSAARWELSCGGRKLVGSAQRRYRHGLLQHGSILLGPAHERLPDLMRIDEPRRRAWAAALAAGSTDLARCAPGPVDRDALVDCLVGGFVRRLGAQMERGELTAAEELRAAERTAALEEVGV